MLLAGNEVFTEFTEAAKVHSNDDGISRQRLVPYHLLSNVVNYSRPFPIPMQLKHTFLKYRIEQVENSRS